MSCVLCVPFLLFLRRKLETSFRPRRLFHSDSCENYDRRRLAMQAINPETITILAPGSGTADAVEAKLEL